MEPVQTRKTKAAALCCHGQQCLTMDEILDTCTDWRLQLYSLMWDLLLVRKLCKVLLALLKSYTVDSLRWSPDELFTLVDEFVYYAYDLADLYSSLYCSQKG